MGKVIKVGDEEYEEIPKLAVAASQMLVETWEKLGEPDDPFSAQGRKVVEFIIKIWQELYPDEAYDWFEARKEHLNAEMTTWEQVTKGTGRSLASIPLPVYRMMRKIFPDFKLNTTEEAYKLVREFPIFKMVNKI